MREEFLVGDKEGEDTRREKMLLMDYVLKVNAIFVIPPTRRASDAKGTIWVSDLDLRCHRRRDRSWRMGKPDSGIGSDELTGWFCHRSRAGRCGVGFI